MGDVVDIDANQPHVTLEVICVKCLHRYQAVAPADLLLRDYDCETCGPGYVIATGQWQD
jgi:hypothetical protein